MIEIALRDILEQRRLAGLRRRNDQRALAFADRREEIDNSRGELRRTVFELEALFGKDRRPLFEYRPSLDRFGVEPVDFVDANQPVIFLALLRPARLAFDHVSAAQLEAAYLRLADVDVVVADIVSGAAQESVALGQDVEYAACDLDTRAGDLRLHEDRDDLVLFYFCRSGDLDFQLFCDFEQLGLRLFRKLSCGKHRRHFDLRKLLVVRSGMLWKVPAARTSTPSAAPLLRPHVVETLFRVGAMFRLQKNISLVEPHTSGLDNRGRGEAASRSDR